MPAITLEHVGNGLFITGDTDLSSARLAFVYRFADPPSTSIPFRSSWRDDDSAGTYCFVSRLPKDKAAFAKRIREKYAPGSGKSISRWLLWFDDPDDADARFLAALRVNAEGSTQTTASFRFGNASVLFPKGAKIAAGENRFQVTGPLVLHPDSDTPGADGDASQLIAALEIGVAAAWQASLRFDVDVNKAGLEALDIGLRYFWKDSDSSDPYGSVRFPLIESDGESTVPLNGRLDPFEPVTGGQSFYRFRSGPEAEDTHLATYLRTASGRRIGLIPVCDPGDSLRLARLVFAPNPARKSKAPGTPLYLTPDGDFELVCPVSDSGESAGARLLTGLAGAEHVSFRPGQNEARGDLLSFFAGQPALAPAPGIGDSQTGGEGRASLSDQLTTSWVGLRAHPESAGAPSSNRYFAQPDDAPLFAPAREGSDATDDFLSFFEFPAAILPEPSSERCFPMVPHAGVDGEGRIAHLARRLEVGVLSPTRKRRISATATSPRSLTATDGPRTDSTTPQGLVAGVQGSHWTDLLLAYGDELLLQVKDVSDAFQRALQTNKLFLVVSRDGALGAFSKGISIGGWPFEIDLGASVEGDQGSAIGNVLIFKFYDELIEDLVRDLGAWSDPDGFNTEPTRLQSWLLDYFAQARKNAASGPDDPEHQLYTPFVREVLDNPNWNGIIALSVSIPLDSLPEDMQGLMGGIDTSRFKAHHLGIELNQVRSDASGIDKSSLFALIDYRGSPDAIALLDDASSAYDFKVKTLQVLFANSEIKDFRSRILLTLNQLFDEEASLEDGDEGGGPGEKPNTIELQGSYERHRTGNVDGQGGPQYETAYSFTYEGKKVFELDSPIIESVEIDQVRFTTVATSDQQRGADKTEVASEFSFWGSLEFGKVGDLDFFSFDDLGFAELKLGMVFDIIDGKAGKPSYHFDPGNISFDVSFSRTRQDSLLGNFPLRLSGFTYASRGFSVEKRGYISVPDLIPGVGAGTDTPHFGLAFNLDLGSMGALTSAVKGFAIDVLAAWAPQSAGGGVDFGVKLPESGGGKKEIGIEGVLTLKADNFGLRKIPADAASPPYVYAFFLKKSVLTVFSTRLPPGDGEFDLLLFVPRTGKGSVDASSIGWFVAYSDPGEAGGEDEPEESAIFLKYLCLGQHVRIPDKEAASMRTVEEALTTLSEKIVPNAQGDEQIEQLNSVYDPDGGWLIGIDVTLYEAVRLGIVFAEPKLYGLLVGLYEPEALRNFQFQVLYKKVNDDIGVYQIVVQLPDAIRQLEFGAVSVSMPVVGVDIYTNGDFRLDFGFPQGKDFSSSFALEAFPFVGFGGFYFSRLSGATSTTVPDVDPDKGRFDPVLELGFGLSLGVGKTIERGIMRAGLTVTFEGVLEGTAAYFVLREKSLPAVSRSAPLTSIASALDKPPDFYRVRGQFALVGTIYGTVDFGIVKATLNVTIWAGVSVTFEAYEDLLLEIAAGVTVKLTVVVGGIRVFGHKIEIKVSFSFETTIRYQWTLVDDRKPPYEWALQATAPKRLPRVEPAAQAIAWKAARVFPEKRPITLYLAPHLTTAIREDEKTSPQRAQMVATLAIECAPGGEQPAEPAPFDLLVEGLLIWAIGLSTDSEEIDAAALRRLSRRLAVPITLARTEESPLTYYGPDGVAAGPLQEFLAQNFDITVAGFPEADSGVGVEDAATGTPTLAATVFPIIPDLSLDHTGASDPVRFWDHGGLFDDAYQDSLAEYLAQLITNFEPKRADGEAPAIEKRAGSSVATLLLEDYFALLIKAAVEHAERYLESMDSGAISVDALIEGMRKVGACADIAGMAARFLQHGLRLPPAFPVRTTLPAYRMDGQQISIVLPESADWTAALSVRQGVSWIKTDPAERPTLSISTEDDRARQRIRDLESAKVSTDGVAAEPLPPLLRTVASYAFENHAEWLQKDSGEIWTIWHCPISLRRELDTHQSGEDLMLTLHRGQVDGGPRREPDPDPDLPHAWALNVDFSLGRIPRNSNGGGTGSRSFLANTYHVGGTDEDARHRLERLLDRVAGGNAPAIDSCRLLFAREDGAAGLVSPVVDAEKILLLKTNLSTESAPPQFHRRDGAGSTDSDEDVFSASLADRADFLRLLWEVSIVNAPGYYLYYRDEDGGGIPEGAFDESTGKAAVSLVVTFASRAAVCGAPTSRGVSDAPMEAERVAAFCNALVVRRDISEQELRAGPRGDPKAVLYAQAPEVPVWRPAFEPGCVGFRLLRPNPARHQTEAGDVQAHVDNIFNLLAYWLPEGDDFRASPKGLPVGPVETDADAGNDAEPDHWTYEHVVPVYRYAKGHHGADEPTQEEPIARREMNHFLPIGSVVSLDFQFLDIFGNEMVADQQIPAFEKTVGYFDPLIPIDRWPSLSLDWQPERDQNKLPWLVVEVAFDPSAYEGSGAEETPAEEEARRRRVQTDLERYDRIAEQLLGPGVSLGALSSLAPGHDLSQRARLIELQHFVNKIRRALSRLSSGKPFDGPDVAPGGSITQRLLLGIDDDQMADQEQNIFELTLDLQISRDRKLLDPQAAEEYPEAGAVRTRVPPRASSEKSQGQMAFDGFAESFEQAFPDLKLASGLGKGGPRSLFAVRIESGEATRRPGIRYRIDPERKGAYFYAPAPLSNTLVSREILSFGDADAPGRVSGVDLDVWAREFLVAVDRFLAADQAVPARQNAPEAYERIVDAKRGLADAIASGVTRVIEQDPPEVAVAEARRAFRQRLLVDLSSAYEIDTVVQYEAATRNSHPEPVPANLYGKVVSSNGTTMGAEAERQAGITLSSAKLALPDGESLLTFLFSTRTPRNQSHVPLDLAYHVTHVEHQISHQTGPTDRYRSSSWLTFVRGLDRVDLGAADIPVALREYPRPPSLLRQSALAASAAQCPAPDTGERNPLQNAKLWNYSFTYQQRSVAQDTVFSNVKFNVPDDHGKAMMAADRDPDLVDWLARFRRRYADLESELPSQAAVESFADLVEGVAGVWAVWIQSRRTSGWPRLLTRAGPTEYEYQHRIEETEHGGPDDVEVEVRISAEGETPSVFPYLAVDTDGERRCLAPEEQGSGKALYRFTRGEGPTELRERTIIFARLDVLDTENAWGGVQLVRNMVLLPGDSSPSTNPVFVYQTPLVRFVNKKTPLLDVRDPIDIAESAGTPSEKTLEAYLASLFSSLFESADRAVPGARGDSSQRRIQVTVWYGYDLRGGPHEAARGPDDAGRPIVYLPVLHRPPVGFDLDTDARADSTSSLVSRLAASLVAWLEKEAPSNAGGFFVFDLAVFAALSDAQLPILRLRRLWLGLDRLKEPTPAP